MLSRLYRLHERIPVDFVLVAHKNERAVVPGHLDALRAGDVIVFDRGYYSWDLLDHHVARGLHPVFGIKAGANAAFDAFRAGDRTEAIVPVKPGAEAIRARRASRPDAVCPTHRVRLVTCAVAGNTYVLATTLLDSTCYPIAALAEVYHGRWSIEDLYKIGKVLLKVEDFHARGERLVKQEVYVSLVVITLTRLCANRAEDHLNAGRPEDDPRALQTDFRDSR